jgi:ferritin-like metal-binding protein YciE
MPEQSASDRKLVQYLNEAYGLEKRSETALRAHAASASKPANKKRMKQHLVETKRHAREIKQRIKQLGGVAQIQAEPITPEAQATPKATAPAATTLHASVASDEEEQLTHAKIQYALESEEIALYMAIESLAETLTDKDTLRMARVIHREQERMRSFLEKEIPRLAKAVGKAELSPAPRSASPRARRALPRRAATAASATRPAVARKRPTASASAAQVTVAKQAPSGTAPEAPSEMAA